MSNNDDDGDRTASAAGLSHAPVHAVFHTNDDRDV